MKSERQAIVLKAIVEDYVATREPVGSKAVVERHHLGVSTATIRNDMAQLEEAGLIVQPHTSAGRIPTDAGYRVFVDSISEIRPLSRAQRAAIEAMLDGAVDLDDVLDRTVRLLAQITHQVAVVQYPSLRRVGLRRVELVPIGNESALVVIITDAGRVEQRTVKHASDLDIESLHLVSDALNSALTGRSLNEIESDVTVSVNVPSHLGELASNVRDLIAQTLKADEEERVVVAGIGNLTRHAEEPASVSLVLDKLEEQVVLLRLLANQAGGLGVRIGADNADVGLDATSVVSADYYGKDSEAVARLGIVGPTRMDYPGAMSSVYAVAKYLSDLLEER